MSIFTDLKSIYTGRKALKRDIKAIEVFEKDHQPHHLRDAEWDCGAASREFYGTLGLDIIQSGDIIARAAYSIDAHKYAAAKQAKQAATATYGSTPKMSFIEVEAHEGDTEQDIFNRAVEKFKIEKAFEEIVSTVSETKKKKGGK